MTNLGQFEFMPGRIHRCSPPAASGPDADSHLPVGAVWKCLDGTPVCGKRWRVTCVDDAFGGDLGWVRRRLPWRPVFGVERRAEVTS